MFLQHRHYTIPDFIVGKILEITKHSIALTFKKNIVPNHQFISHNKGIKYLAISHNKDNKHVVADIGYEGCRVGYLPDAMVQWEGSGVRTENQWCRREAHVGSRKFIAC